MKKHKKSNRYNRIRSILESARTTAARSVHSTQGIVNWLVGREIVKEEQQGKIRAEYGASVLPDISYRLQSEFGAGYSIGNLEFFHRSYIAYPGLISDAVRRKSETGKNGVRLFKRDQLSLPTGANPIQKHPEKPR